MKGEAVVDDDPASAHRTRAHVGDGLRDGDGPALEEEAPEDGNTDAVDAVGVEDGTERARAGEV